jgi:hypothetical protein
MVVRNCSLFSLFLLLEALLPGCTRPQDGGPPPFASAIPVASAEILKEVNPEGRPAYRGPTARVRGVVRATGDEAPFTGLSIGRDACAPAREVYQKVFREGPGRSLADVLVAVTEYDGYVPPRAPTVDVSVRDCAWDRRTYAVTYGQNMSVKNLGPAEGHLPALVGSRQTALLLALPNGDPVTLNPNKVGHFVLSDATHEFMRADVFVLRYSTTAVTSLDGTYSIENIPVGKVKVSAFLPATGAVQEKSLDLTADQTIDLDFQLGFDRVAYDQMVAAAAPRHSGPVVH